MHTGQDIVYRRCIFNRTGNGVRIKASPYHGGSASNITYEDLQMFDVGTPIFLDLNYGGSYLKKESATPTRVFNISYKNITASSWGQYGHGGIIRCGFGGAPHCNNITVSNVRIRASTCDNHTQMPYCGQIGWECINVSSGVAERVVPPFERNDAAAPSPPGEPHSNGCVFAAQEERVANEPAESGGTLALKSDDAVQIQFEKPVLVSLSRAASINQSDVRCWCQFCAT